MFGRHCPVCGARMARFENPKRYLCPKESSHERIMREVLRQEQAGNAGRTRGKPKGGRVKKKEKKEKKKKKGS